MDKKLKRGMILVAFGVILYAVLMNISDLYGGVKGFFGLLLPVIWGLIIAFILNVPMSALERLFTRITSKWKHKPPKIVITVVSLVITLIVVALILVLAITIVVPDIIESLKRIYYLVVDRLPELEAWLESKGFDGDKLTNFIKELDLQSMLDRLGDIFSAVGTVMDYVFTVAAGVVNVVLALIVALYTLLSKELLLRQTNRIMFALCRTSHAEKVVRVAKLTSHTFSKFISGQGVESIILALMIFTTFSIFGLPYAVVTAFLTCISAFIPYVGAFFACAIGALLTLLEDPSKVLLCIIVYTVTQFIENQFVYPHVVGNSVGLPALWTLVAVMVGGSMMGLFGMIFFIPLTAVIYTLVRSVINNRIEKKVAADPDHHIDSLIDDVPEDELDIPDEFLPGGAERPEKKTEEKSEPEAEHADTEDDDETSKKNFKFRDFFKKNK